MARGKRLDDDGETCQQYVITDQQRIAARRTIAANAVDVTEAAEIMRMLGIHPSQDAEAAAAQDKRLTTSVPKFV